jgi:gamma-glutamylcyclotransferase (GGCT)/AIG2-like uncharacterized protein YtfP
MPESVPNCSCNCLAVYGSLQPGGPNEHILVPLEGSWTNGFVRGTLEQSGWGAKVGFPGMRLSDQGDLIAVKLFQSPKLDAFWEQLDEFEGEEYIRQSCVVETKDGLVTACIYALA